MERIERDSMADIVFNLKWESEHAHHLEGYSARNVNFWRDWLPEQASRALLGKPAWEQIQVGFEPGALFGNKGKPLTIDRKRFSMAPRAGRFYPQGRLSGIADVFPQNIQPFRIIGIDNGHMEVDLGHPLARYPLALSMTVGQVSDKAEERGGSSIDWVGLLTEGPGMQARWQDVPTDFFSDAPFVRQDDGADDRFYAQPRLVHHLDETARDMVASLYRRFVKNDMQVLDLMSSWASHLPEDINPAGVSGLGLNRIELEQNPRLTDIRVHDLNANPLLPYGEASFDVAICSLSVEYLTQPLAVFADVARVLKPGGTFVVSFSNRWFPPKAIRIWEQIHEFERVGLVMEYFLRSGRFDNLGTYSMRGLPRPRNDKYAGERVYSDPLYAVWGSRIRE